MSLRIASATRWRDSSIASWPSRAACGVTINSQNLAKEQGVSILAGERSRLAIVAGGQCEEKFVLHD